MTAVWGNKIKLTIFGESHGEAIGIVIDNIPAGIKVDYDYIYSEMDRRKPGKNNISTSRCEEDTPRVISGVFNGFTTGAPICVVIENKDNKSKDYSLTKDIARPGHADYTARVKYGGFNDYRGGGHFSGRMTAPIVFAGSLCKSILKDKGINVYTHIKSLGDIEDTSFFEYIEGQVLNEKSKFEDITKSELNYMYEESFKSLRNMEIPVIDKKISSSIREKIIEVKNMGDSVGGIVECCLVGVDSGIGNPFFESVESVISSLIFSIPGVKGVEFGSGFDITRKNGSEANDEFRIDSNGDILTNSNHNGGINGGITNSMPIEFSVALKPTPSIFKTQKSIYMESNKNIEFNIKGRHDPTIVLRAIPVIESMAAIAITDFII